MATRAPKAESANLKKTPEKASTSVAVRKSAGGAVVDAAALREQLRAQAAAMSERTAPASGNKISIGQDKTMKLPDGSKVTEIRAVIVDFVTVHNFYEGAFDAKNIQPPACFAVGTNPKDMAPVDESPVRQADNCQVCPMNEYGSDGEGKACKNGRLLALLPLNDAGDDVDAEADMLLMSVSPTALKGFDGYVQQVARTFQVPPVGVITTISFDPNSSYSRLQFGDATPIPGIAGAFARQGEAKDMLMGKPDFSGYKAPAPKGKQPAARAAARR